MTIWQYSFLVVPKKAFDSKDHKSYVDEDGFFDDESCWSMDTKKIDFFNDIEKILEKKESWSDQIILFGDQDSNRFEVYKDENNNVISASFRIDYTSEFEGILRAIIDFTIMNELIILDEKLEVAENNFVTIKALLDNSQQRDVYEKLKNKEEE